MEEKNVIKAKNINIGYGNTNSGNVSIIGDNNSTNIVVRPKVKKTKTKKTQCYEGIKEPYIFISYSHKDIKKVYPIINLMKKDGYRIWYDTDINPGRKWDQCIETTLKQSSIFIGFFSRFYWKSGPCIEEISYACSLSQFESDGIIPVYLDDTDIPDNLGLQMHLSSRQSIFGYRYDSPEDICNMIYKNDLIYKCQMDKNATAVRPR